MLEFGFEGLKTNESVPETLKQSSSFFGFNSLRPATLEVFNYDNCCDDLKLFKQLKSVIELAVFISICDLCFCLLEQSSIIFSITL